MEKTSVKGFLWKLGVYFKYAVLLFAALTGAAFITLRGLAGDIGELVRQQFSGVPYHETLIENIELLLRGRGVALLAGTAFISLLVSFKITFAVIRALSLKSRAREALAEIERLDGKVSGDDSAELERIKSKLRKMT